MRHYTTIEQSKKLLELGLNPDTADMSYSYDFNDSRYVITTTPVKNWIVPKYAESIKIQQVLPCWSLGALLELMPKICEDENDGGCYPTLCKGYNTSKWHCVYRSSIYITNWCDTSIDAVFEMVLWLLENGYIKTKKK